jgi:hypothetical protein
LPDNSATLGIEQRVGFPGGFGQASAEHAIIGVLFQKAFRMRAMCLLIVAAAMAGCASEPSQQVATTSPSTSPAPAAPAPAAPAAPAVADAAATPAEGGAFNPPPGYQKKTRGTSTVYCKSDTPVGTRFAKEYCYTQQDLERMEASRSNTVQEVERARKTCVGPGCGGG